MTTLTDKLTRAAALTKQRNALEAQLKPIIAELDEIKFQLKLEMQLLHSKKTDAVDGFYATRVATPKLIIENQEELDTWLAENTDDPNYYYKPDTAKLQSLQDRVMQESGEILPGVGTQVDEHVRITPVAKKGGK